LPPAPQGYGVAGAVTGRAGGKRRVRRRVRHRAAAQGGDAEAG
jgi:hypothetical protein